MFPDVSLPASVQAIIVTIVFFMPGFIAGKVFSLCFRRAALSEQVQLVEYVTLSCVNYGFWSWLILLIVQGQTWEASPWAFLLAVVLVLFISPVALGFLMALAVEKEWFSTLARRYGVTPPHHLATAWDWFFRTHREKRWWITIRLRNGIMIRGFFGWHSFAGSDPDRRDLFLEAECDVDNAGRFRVIDQTAGVYLKDADIQTIELWNVQEQKVQGQKEKTRGDQASSK